MSSFFFVVLSDITLGVLCWILDLSIADTGMQIKKAVLSLFILKSDDSLKYELILLKKIW